MISDRQLNLSLTQALAWLLWTVMVAGLALGTVLHISALDYVGLAASAAAATVHMRGFMCHFSTHLKAAFELGREVEREQQSQRRDLHSIT